MYITESLCCTAEINITLEINYTSVRNFVKKHKYKPCKEVFQCPEGFSR